MIISGVDPGANGALVTLFEDGSTNVMRVPKFSTARTGLTKAGNKRAPKVDPDHRKWANEWRMQLLFSAPDVFVVEKVGAWTGQGVKSVWSFAHSTGFALATIMYIDVPIHPADPNVWKVRLGLMGLPKSASIELAAELIPSLKPHLTRAKDDGVAEAGLLAYYGRMTIAA